MVIIPASGEMVSDTRVSSTENAACRREGEARGAVVQRLDRRNLAVVMRIISPLGTKFGQPIRIEGTDELKPNGTGRGCVVHPIAEGDLGFIELDGVLLSGRPRNVYLIASPVHEPCPQAKQSSRCGGHGVNGRGVQGYVIPVPIFGGRKISTAGRAGTQAKPGLFRVDDFLLDVERVG
jgi:hypothetical protein